jgi:hypothetical protein
MIDRIETHPTLSGSEAVDQRSGKDRRQGTTMLDPDMDQRRGERRKSCRRLKRGIIRFKDARLYKP